MNVTVVYDNIKDKEFLDNIDLKVPFFISYIDLQTKNGRKEGFAIKSHWGAIKNPFIELKDDEDKIIKVFYSEVGNACNQLIKYLNDCKN